MVATDINNVGQIVGYFYDGNIWASFLYSGGACTTFSDPLGSNTLAYGINDEGQIVGSVNTAATPLLATLPLFATGLGAVGLLGWRRKRGLLTLSRVVYSQNIFVNSLVAEGLAQAPPCSSSCWGAGF